MAIELTEDTYKQWIDDVEGVSVVQFTAPWCVPCRMLSPRLEELTTERNVTYFKVDVDTSPGLARDFQIMSVPTLFFYRDSELINTTVGIKQKKELEAELDAL